MTEKRTGGTQHDFIATHLKSEMMVWSVYVHLSDCTVKLSFRFAVLLIVLWMQKEDSKSWYVNKKMEIMRFVNGTVMDSG